MGKMGKMVNKGELVGQEITGPSEVSSTIGWSGKGTNT